jgi:hypothetical protein
VALIVNETISEPSPPFCQAASNVVDLRLVDLRQTCTEESGSKVAIVSLTETRQDYVQGTHETTRATTASDVEGADVF